MVYGNYLQLAKDECGLTEEEFDCIYWVMEAVPGLINL